MSEQEKNVELVREALTAFQREDAEALLAFLDPQVEVFAAPEMANSGSFSGHEGWATWVGEWLSVWDDYKVEAINIEAIGERHVVMQARQTGRGKGSGVPVELDVCFMLELHDGRATRYHLYPSREQALEAVREREPEGG